MGGGHGVHIIAFAICRAVALELVAVPGGYAFVTAPARMVGMMPVFACVMAVVFAMAMFGGHGSGDRVTKKTAYHQKERCCYEFVHGNVPGYLR